VARHHPVSEADDLFICVGVFIHWTLGRRQIRITTTPTKEALARAVKASRSAEVVAKRNDANTLRVTKSTQARGSNAGAKRSAPSRASPEGWRAMASAKARNDDSRLPWFERGRNDFERIRAGAMELGS